MASHLKMKIWIISLVLLWTVEAVKLKDGSEGVDWASELLDIEEVKELKDDGEAAPGCMEIDLWYYGNDLKSKTNVPTAEACAEFCSEEAECFAWTWNTNEYSSTSSRQKCYLKTSSWSERQFYKEGKISGQKNCVACEDKRAAPYCTNMLNVEGQNCEGNPAYMKVNCKRTCGVCQDESSSNENNIAPTQATIVDLAPEKKCMGPIKCNWAKFCTGFEGDKVYCYGDSTWCLWNSNDCETDADCQKYTTSSPKYSGDKAITCSGAYNWEEEACTCDTADKKCNGPTKCGSKGQCIGFEGDNIFCYGKFSSCLENTCVSDADCQKYSSSSAKYSEPGAESCTTPASTWMKDACKCRTTAPLTGEAADRACVEDANFYRRRHPGTPLLEYDPEVSAHAQAWADKLKAENGGNMEHASVEERNGEGENLMQQSWDGPLDKVAGCKHANAYWYDEFHNYNYETGEKILDASGNAVGSTGHLTAMLWKNTIKVGFGVIRNERGQLIVGRYFPGGNYAGQYVENVLPPAAGLDPPNPNLDTLEQEQEVKELKDEVIGASMSDAVDENDFLDVVASLKE